MLRVIVELWLGGRESSKRVIATADKFDEIPEPARTFLRRNVATSTCLTIDETTNPMDCAYAEDWDRFLFGNR
ncbi:hypothetical protein DIE23_06575 [Burkholderia sp. Bp9143]|nr:hypothetical protein DIE23_06575 [Burkholderia sp. Bp9143]